MMVIHEAEWGEELSRQKKSNSDGFKVMKEHGVLKKLKEGQWMQSRKWWEEGRADHERYHRPGKG